jgi:hypothetical protein
MVGHCLKVLAGVAALATILLASDAEAWVKTKCADSMKAGCR